MTCNTELEMAFKYCYVNLNIDDLLKSQVDTNTTGNFVYGMRSFDRVEIFGTAVSVREYDEKSIYQIDDCTGVVACHEFKTNSEATSAVKRFDEEVEVFQANCSSGIPEISLANLEEIAASLEASTLMQSGSFKLGDFIQIRGQLKEYQGARRVWVHFAKILEDPNWETVYLSRQLELYKKVYHCKTNMTDA